MKWLLLLPCALANALPALSGADLASGRAVNWKPGKPSVIVFLSSECPCSQAHESSISALAKSYPSFEFIGIVSNPSDQTASHFQKVKLSFSVIVDRDQTWANAFGAVSTPHSFVVNPQGEVVFQGGVDDSRDPERAKRFYLKEALEAMEGGRQVTVAQSRPLGCPIRR